MRNSWLILGGCTLIASLFANGCGSSSGPDIHANLDAADAMRSSIRRAVVGEGDGAEEQAAAEPTGFATLKGRFRLQGSIPSRTELAITKDASVCRPGGQPVLSQELVVNSENQGIRDVLIFVSSKVPNGDPKWEHESYAATRDALLSGTRAFDQKACRFLFHVYAMRSTQSLEVINSDPVGHNVNIQPDTARVQPLNVTVPGNGGTAVWKPGGESTTPVPVSCSIHPWMRAYILPRDNPFFAVSDANGEFEIAYVPAGVELEFRLWQEKSGFVSGKVTLNGNSQNLKKGRIKNVTLDPDQLQQWDFVLSDQLFK